MKKVHFLILVVFVLFSCGADATKEVVFTFEKLNEKDFETCKENKCPKIEIRYLEAEGKGEVPKKINQRLNQKHIALLSISPDQEKTTSLRKAVEQFIAGNQRFQKEFPKFPANYEIRIAEEIAHRSKEIVVVKTEHYLFTGGAHGYGATSYNTFSLETGALLTPKDLFANIDSFTAYVEKKFREKYEIPKDENINSTGFFFENDVFSLPNNLAILEDEVILVYHPYEVAAYTRGEMQLSFSKAEVKKWLKYN